MEKNRKLSEDKLHLYSYSTRKLKQIEELELHKGSELKRDEDQGSLLKKRQLEIDKPELQEVVTDLMQDEY
ncbi:hypothetical protein RCL_jg3977.t1 [Rhizophagus clarus]|uniref:Uncharacterized protein n=1 Tax=Rhizophagus clarus TaxID=94130 RepID=A0A8H3KPK5_9GLOM|nr:hypothetical protein RCL_jg3977.t1 [Rhizophagus clarus]